MKYSFFGLTTKGIPRHAILSEILSEDWENIVQFQLDFAGTHRPVCRICRHEHTVSSELVVRTPGIYFPPSVKTEASFVQWVFCTSPSCIKTLTCMKGNEIEDYTGASYAFSPFQRKITLPSSIKSQLTPTQQENLEKLQQSFQLQFITKTKLTSLEASH